MENGQKQFLDYILARVQPDMHNNAEALLLESFARQADGTFDDPYLQYVNESLIPMLKPEAVGEVADVLKQFGPSHISGKE